MTNTNLDNSKKLHFIGIGGIGLSAIAALCLEKNKIVTGSDTTKSLLTKSLETKGAKISYKHTEKNIEPNTDLVIYSPAIPESNKERQFAKNKGIKQISYPQALGELTLTNKTIAICGTHGKSTTTAITAIILQQNNLDPSVVIGTKVREFNNQNYRAGKNNILVIEACEYKESFLNLKADILVITNIEKDHLDHYKTEENYINAFKLMIENLKENTTIITNTKSKNIKTILEKTKGHIEKNKIKILDINKETKNLTIKPKVIGDFNIENAKNAATVAKLFNIKNKEIEKSIQTFNGTWRRMEIRETSLKHAKIIDDYGHHPTEIKATLKALKENNPNEKILCVFQPHQYSRTLFLLKDFATSFKNADKVIIPNIYEVRDNEDDKKRISTKILVDEINRNEVKEGRGEKAENGNGIENTTKLLKKYQNTFDTIITMGAGNIVKIYESL